MSPVPEPAGLRVLITNRILANRTGTELYVRDVAAGLLARGHRPVVYTPLPGRVAEEIRAATIPVVDDLARVGAAVVLCDLRGAGAMVTTENLDRLRPLNFGMRTLGEPATAAALAREIARYDPADAAEVSRRIRRDAGSGALVDQLVAVYRQVIAEHRAVPAGDPAAEARAAAAYLQALAPRLHQRDLLRDAFLRRLRVPVVGALLRGRPGLAGLLRSMDAD